MRVRFTGYNTARIEHHHNATPSWKRHGEGLASLRIDVNNDLQWMEIEVEETAFPENGGRISGKAASITLNRELAEELYGYLKDQFEPVTTPALTAHARKELRGALACPPSPPTPALPPPVPDTPEADEPELGYRFELESANQVAVYYVDGVRQGTFVKGDGGLWKFYVSSNTPLVSRHRTWKRSFETLERAVHAVRWLPASQCQFVVEA